MTGRPTLSARNITRAVLSVVALVTAFWGISAVSARVQAGADVDAVATRILQDKPYTRERLVRLRDTGDKGDGASCSEPRFALAVVQLRLFEQSLTVVDSKAAETERGALDRSIAALMRCNPNDSFFPLVAAALALNDGDDAAFMSGLRRSYRNGPFENWVSLRRSPIALGHLDRLPPDLAEQAVAEFANLVNSGLNDDAEAIFIPLAAEVRGQLLSALPKKVSPKRYRSFMSTLTSDHKKRRSRGSRKLIENFSLPSGTSLDPVTSY